MAFLGCSMCRTKPRGRMANIYWACWTGDGDREAWKQRYCKGCYGDACSAWLDALFLAGDERPAGACALCPDLVEDDLVQLYATGFVPGKDAYRFAFDLCPPHFNEAGEKARAGSEPLRDRLSSFERRARGDGW
jgi:hypothetical protein